MRLVRGTTRFNGAGLAAVCTFDADGRLWVLRLGDPNTLTAFDRDGNALEVREVGRARGLVGNPPAAIDATVAARGPSGTLATARNGTLTVGDRTWTAHDRDCWAIHWVDDRIATGGWDHHARVFAPDGTLLTEVATNNVRAVWLDGNRLYTGGGSGWVRCWDAAGAEVGPALEHTFAPGGAAGVQSVVVQHGVVYTWANDCTVRAWRDGTLLWATHLPDHFKGQRAMAVGADRIAVAGTHGPVAVLTLDGDWVSERGLPADLATLEPDAPVRRDRGHLAVHQEGTRRRVSRHSLVAGALGPDGTWMVALGRELSWFWLVPVQLEVRHVGRFGSPHDVAVSDSGALVAVAHEAGVAVWATADGTCVAELAHPRAGGVVFVAARAVVFNARTGLFRWDLDGEPVPLAPAPHAAERYLERDAGWPIRRVGGAVEFLGADGNVWAVDVYMEPDPGPQVHPSDRPAEIDWPRSVWNFNGRFGQLDKAVGADRVAALGGTVAKSLTKQATHLVVGLGLSAHGERVVTSAEAKARARGLPVLTEADFLHLVEPTADEVRAWDGAALTAWRTARPKGGTTEKHHINALVGIQWPGAPLAGADLVRADLRGADLSGADLSRADISQADLRGANLRGANLQGARFFRTKLEDCDLDGFLGSPNWAGADWGASKPAGAGE
ncbi:MAG: hypothetical protein ACI8PZ_007168 [Myxococcota bacterium]|jgi:hypothetical protein